MARDIDIDKRTLKFGVDIIHFINLLPKTTAGIAIANQIIRSGTSIGANIQEAFGGHTKAEFIHKMNIAKSEARETKYWLNLIFEAKMVDSNTLQPLLKETDELVAILTSIVKNSKISK